MAKRKHSPAVPPSRVPADRTPRSRRFAPQPARRGLLILSIVLLALWFSYIVAIAVISSSG